MSCHAYGWQLQVLATFETIDLNCSKAQHTCAAMLQGLSLEVLYKFWIANLLKILNRQAEVENSSQILFWKMERNLTRSPVLQFVKRQHARQTCILQPWSIDCGHHTISISRQRRTCSIHGLWDQEMQMSQAQSTCWKHLQLCVLRHMLLSCIWQHTCVCRTQKLSSREEPSLVRIWFEHGACSRCPR